MLVQNQMYQDAERMFEYLNTASAQQREAIVQLLPNVKCFNVGENVVVSASRLVLKGQEDMRPFFYLVPSQLLKYPKMLNTTCAHNFK